MLQREAIQEAEIAGEHGEAPQRNQQSEDDKKHAAEDLHRVQMAPEARIKGEKTIHSQGCEKKRHGQSGRKTAAQRWQ